MKKLFYFLGISTFLIVSCSKDPVSATPTPATSTSYVKYKVNGVLQENTPILEVLATIDTNGLQLIGIGSEYQITISSKLTQSTGTYDMKNTALKTVLLVSKGGTGGTSYQVEKTKTRSSGTLTITKIKDIGNRKFAANGTFSGVAENASGETVTITDGEFFDVRTN